MLSDDDDKLFSVSKIRVLPVINVMFCLPFCLKTMVVKIIAIHFRRRNVFHQYGNANVSRT